MTYQRKIFLGSILLIIVVLTLYFANQEFSILQGGDTEKLSLEGECDDLQSCQDFLESKGFSKKVLDENGAELICDGGECYVQQI